MLTCDNIVKKYYSCTAVDGVSLNLEPGRITALLGPNGSGKSTFMKMIVGLIKPTSGHIYLEGEEISDATRAFITYMPTENYFYNYMTVKDIVNFYVDFYPDFSKDRFYGLLERMELHFEDKVRNMSTGMLAKLKIAVAMSRNSKVIMLDEPLNGIDIIARENVMDAITDYAGTDKILIVSSHLVDELEKTAGYVIYMRDGRIVEEGDTDTVRSANDGMSLVDIYKKIYRGYGNGQAD